MSGPALSWSKAALQRLGEVLAGIAQALVVALLFTSAQACGGQGAAVAPDAEGPDAPTTNDANVASPEAMPDALGPIDSQVSGEGSALAPGTGTLSGSLAFPVGRVITAAPTHSPFSSGGDCSGTAVPAPGVVAAVVVLFAETGFAAENICNPNGLPDGGTNSILDLEVATPEWATYPGTLTQALVPGTYTISNEQTNSESLCKLRGGGTAYLTISPWGDYARAIAVSGTVTIDSIAAASVTGRFEVMMGGPFGQTDGAAPTRLSGTFDATACP